jgi:Leucine-rich repeat (LRR) protein
MSRILNIFLSSELNRNLTRRIYLPFNRLTQIPKEISLFRRLQKINLNHNKIVSIQTAYSDSSSDVTPRLIRLDFRSNRLNYIEAGAFLGDNDSLPYH